MSSHRRSNLASLLLLAVAVACGGPGSVRSFSSSTNGALTGGAAETRSRNSDDPTLRRIYGPAVAVGNGVVRTYIAYGEANHMVPLEVGVAIAEGALEGLPARNPNHHAPADGHEHLDSHVYDLSLPTPNPTPYTFVEFDWNPGGHEPPGIYDMPHFDFHFYTVAKAVRDGIDPAKLDAGEYAAKSARLPVEGERSPFFLPATPPGQPVMAVPRMGLHWVDVRSPELQGMLGKPADFRPFTTTFIRGSWDGRFIFDEPMITRAFILGRKAATSAASRDSVITLPQPPRRNPAGYYPDAYRITYDEQAKEYRVGLTRLMWRD